MEKKKLPTPEEVGLIIQLFTFLRSLIAPTAADRLRKARKAHQKAKVAYEARIWEMISSQRLPIEAFETHMKTWLEMNPRPGDPPTSNQLEMEL